MRHTSSGRRALAIAALSILGACASPDSGVAGDPRAGEAEVARLLEEILAADNAGDVERVLAHYSEDAMLLPPERPVVEGRAAMRPHYAAIFAGARLALRGHIDELRLGGGWGVMRGRIEGEAEARADGRVTRVHDRFLAVVERGGDGRWRFARLMWTHIPKDAAGDARG